MKEKSEQLNNIEQLKEKSFTGFISDNYEWIIAVSTFLGVIFFNILKFIEYLTSYAYFWYYGIDHNLYNYFDKNFIYELCLSIIFWFALCSVFYCFKQLGDNLKKRDFFKKENMIDIMLILILNFYMVIATVNHDVSLNITILTNTMILMLCLILLEFSLSWFIFKEEKSLTQTSFNNNLINSIKILPFFLIILIIFHFSTVFVNLKSIREYRIINNNKVIVYSTTDYCIISDCDIVDGKLIIYKGSQEKIENVNVKSSFIEFNEVELK